MTTVPMKKTCVKCVKGTGIVTCDGCYQSFCHKHLSEHRKELLEQMDKIDDQCKQFRKNLREENDPSSILSTIDQWEEESIDKIHSAAESARTEVRRLTERTLTDYNQAVNKITTNMETSRETNDTTEIDLTAWSDQLQALQQLLKQPFPVSVMNDEKQSPILHYIKVKYDSPFKGYTHVKSKPKPKQNPIVQQESRPSDSRRVNKTIEEKFNRVAGHATLSNNNLVFTSYGYSSVEGIKLYGTGIHNIKFEVIIKKNEGIFFGVLASAQEIIPRAPELPSVYGWRDFDRTIVNGNAQLQAHKEKNIQPGDQFTLTMDCDHVKLSLTHHQLNQKIQLSIDVNKCPLPWKLLISSYGEDTVSILH